MSELMFTDLKAEHDRMESLMRARFLVYNLSLTEYKISTGQIFYSAQVTTKDRDSKNQYFQIDGVSFADVFQKISDKVTKTA